MYNAYPMMRKSRDLLCRVPVHPLCAAVCLVACLSFFISTAIAAPVDADKATVVARTFWSQTLKCKDAADLERQPWQYDAVYLFTAPQGGWVMVAADDCARPVLAYSSSGRFDIEQMPAAMRNMLYVYEQEILSAQRQLLSAHDEWSILMSGGALKDTEDDVVEPLLTTQWYQRSPYNQYCPSGTMTGCVATAMAQVLKYWNYPAFGRGSHSYSDDTGYPGLEADFGNTRYAWDQMPDRLTSASSAAQKQAVATLMFHCGISVNMHYSTVYSGTTINKCETALPEYFRFHADDIRYRNKGQLSNAAWTDTLIAELRLRRPVLHGGSGSAGGHCFVCDGYDARRYLHFNLGEDGEGDGYYAVGAISYGIYTFNQANDAILGVHPAYGIYASSETVSFTREGGAEQVWVSTSDTIDAPWTATASDNWITVGNSGFEHLGQITISVADNSTGAERSGTVTLSQGSLSTTITVLQSAYDPATDYCPLTVVMENTHNEPWADDAHLSFESPSGTVYGIARHTANSGASTATVSVAPHDVMVRWHPGGARDRYINYMVKNQYGETLVAVNNAYFDGADVLLEWPCAHLAIDNPVPDGPAQVLCTEVYDLAGRRLTRIPDSDFEHQLTSFPKGIYIIHTITDRGVTVKKTVNP